MCSVSSGVRTARQKPPAQVATSALAERPGWARAARSSGAVLEGTGSAPPRLPLRWVQQGLIAQVSEEMSSEHQRAWREGGGDGDWGVHLCECINRSAAPNASWAELTSPRVCVLPSLLLRAAFSPPFWIEAAAAAPNSVQGKKKSVGKCLALNAAFTAQTSIPCFLQVSRESGTATAMFLAESSTCTAFKWFAYHQWYTTVWEPLV